MDEWITFLEENEGPLGYLFLGLASLIEYLFPPFPGDMIALGGVALASSAAWSPLWIYLSLTLGSLLGGSATWTLGGWLSRREDRFPQFLKTEFSKRALQSIQSGFDKYGPTYLILNRFIPVSRAFFFLGAGYARMPFLRMLFWGGLGAALWNALLLGVGYALSSQQERLETFFRHYTSVSIVLMVVVLTLWWIRARRKKRMSIPPRS